MSCPLAVISFFEPRSKRTRFIDSIKGINNILKKRAIVFFLSDIQGSEIAHIEHLTDALEITSRRHDLICLPIEDQRQLYIPRLGLVAIEDQETGEILEIDTSKQKF
jgi:hypothetical protein